MPLETDIHLARFPFDGHVFVMRYPKFNDSLRSLLGKRGRFIRSTPPLFLGLDRRFANQDDFILGVLRRVGSSLSFNITTISDLVAEASNQGFAAAGERSWIAKYISDTGRSPRARWLRDLSPPRELADCLGGLREGWKGVISLYLRGKGQTEGPSGRWHSVGRDGSTPMGYLDLIRIFNDGGYFVLVTGDYGAEAFPKVRRAGLGIGFPEDFGIDPDLWNLWIPILADGSAGNAGGGMTLAQIARQKSLVIDAFGYWFGMNNAIIHFRTSPEETDRSFRQKFLESPHLQPKYSVSDLSRSSSSDLITLGREYLDFLDGAQPRKVVEDSGGLEFSDEHWMKFCSNSSISSLNRQILTSGG